MELSILVQLFQMAGIKIIKLERIRNRYWPDCAEYRQLIENTPWWLVEIDVGVIEIGWRKRVIVIDWSRTGKKLAHDALSTEDVTKSSTAIHAYGYSDAMELLRKIQQLHYPVTEERAEYCDQVFGRHIRKKKEATN